MSDEETPAETAPAPPPAPSAPAKPGVLMAAEAAQTREQFQSLFANDPGFELLGVVAPSEVAAHLDAQPRVTIVVVEGRETEFLAIREAARRASGPARVIALSRPQVEPIHVLRASEEGAHGHWTTAVGTRNLPIWIRQAAAGTVRMEDRIRDLRGLSDSGPRSRRNLRWQHLAALQLLARGSSNAQDVAWKLDVPRDRAHTLIEQACRCMEAQSPGEAVQQALRQGLIRA